MMRGARRETSEAGARRSRRRTSTPLARYRYSAVGGEEKKCRKKPPYPDVTLCGNRGQVEGCPLCCKAGAEKCARCGLHKGSPACCRINKPEVQKCALAVAGETGEAKDKAPYPVTTLCGKCGQVKGSAMCCSKKPDQERCAMCGLFKGSPGCCRINAAAVQKAAMAQAKAEA